MAALSGIAMRCRTRNISMPVPSTQFLRASPAIRASRGLALSHGVIPQGDGLRQELQAICERVLGVSPIASSDSLLDLGADSLALVNLLLEIEDYTGHP